MVEEQRGSEPRIRAPLVVAGALVILIGCLVFVPFMTCPFHETIQLEASTVADRIIVGTLVMKGNEVVAGSCVCCGKKGRISLFRRCTWRPPLMIPF